MSSQSRRKEVDDLQSAGYAFPYHYLPSLSDFPNFSKRWAFSPSYLGALRLVINWLCTLERAQGHKHMDFGCGDGGFIHALSNVQDFNAIQFNGIDFDEKAIHWAKAFSQNPQQFQCGDIANLPAETFDSGTLIEVLEHVPPDQVPSFVSATAQALKKGACLFVTVPSTEKPVEAKHYRHFDFETLEACFRDHFKVEHIFGFEKTTFFQKILTKLTFNRFWHFETRLANSYLISTFAKPHPSIQNCGRIALLLRRL